VKYLCWYSSQADIENFAAQVEDHGMDGRGGGLVWGTTKVWSAGTHRR